MQPHIVWSEGIDHISIKIDIENPDEEQIYIEEDKICGSFMYKTKKYDLNIDLLHHISTQESYFNKLRFIEIYLKKKENINWGKLTPIKDSRIMVDWNKQILDSDEELLVEELTDDELYIDDSQDSDNSDDSDNELEDNLENLENLEKVNLEEMEVLELNDINIIE